MFSAVFEILVKVIVVFIDISNDVTHLYFIKLEIGIHLPVEMLEAIGKCNQFLYVGDSARGAQVNPGSVSSKLLNMTEIGRASCRERV